MTQAAQGLVSILDAADRRMVPPGRSAAARVGERVDRIRPAGVGDRRMEFAEAARSGADQASRDYCEYFEVDGESDLEPGTVVVLNERAQLTESAKAYDRCVAGVVGSEGVRARGITLARQPGGRSLVPVALVGRVYCKVDATWGDVEVGDLLTTSPTPGHAMRADDAKRSSGSVIGKALARLTDDPGVIPVLVALQ